tara:strand:+ start:739 stop:1026 length:288 start_codon:yes stop_codon:yes gene_type:complete
MRLLLLLTLTMGVVSATACASSVRQSATSHSVPFAVQAAGQQVTNKMNLVIQKDQSLAGESVVIPRTTGIGDVVIARPILVLVPSVSGESASDSD